MEKQRNIYIMSWWVVRLWEKKGIQITIFDCFSFMKGDSTKNKNNLSAQKISLRVPILFRDVIGNHKDGVDHCSCLFLLFLKAVLFSFLYCALNSSYLKIRAIVSRIQNVPSCVDIRLFAYLFLASSKVDLNYFFLLLHFHLFSN